jgi:polyhydroxyalkanoate synthase
MAVSADRMTAASADALLGPNPFVGFRPRDVAREALRVTKLAVTQPGLGVRTLVGLGRELARVLEDKSELAPNSRDRRFADPLWKSSPGYRRWLQAYLALEKATAEWAASQKLAPHSHDRLQFMLSLVLDAIAPSNFPWQPEAVKRFRDSGGHSALDGVKNLWRDVRDNGGLPSQVDKKQFRVGSNIANTPGAVVLRGEVFELIRYAALAPQVRDVPLLFVPPQINKYYIFDLAPEKSVVRAALEAGFDVYIVSWRNPGPEHRDWGLAEYAAAIEMAISAICNLSACGRVNLAGACAGGLTLAAYVAARTAGGDTRVNSLTLLVNVLDTKAIGDTPLGLFATDTAIREARRRSASKGVLDGKEMAAAFNWLRPNDLIWNYWVNNVLLGNAPPAFDLLYWNNDNTRLPARLHSEFLDIFTQNALTHAGKLRIHGIPVDLKRIRCDSYITGGTTDHITPWKACYRTTQLFGGTKTFVLSNAGHMQSILNPPGNRKSEFWSGGDLVADPEAWRSTATHHPGSWWPHWHDWLHARSGEMRAAPAELGGPGYLLLGPAPGEYVHR